MKSLRRGIVLICTALLTVAVTSAAVSSDATAGTPAFSNADGITVVSATADGPRLWRFVVSTPALSQPVRVNVLLPTGYGSTRTHYPTLYLFHGTSGGADDWINDGNVVAATAGYPMIVVMPDAGYNGDGGGWFTNWVDQQTSLGTADWETFHIDQLIPWIDANFRTIATRDGRAIAGLSQGGFGSFSYAARHPDTFVSAASFSGAPDISQNIVTALGAALVVGGTASGLDGVEPFAMFGNPLTDDINWQGHNPANLVTNMGDTDLELWTGTGIPGPLDTNLLTALGGSPIETITHISTLSWVAAAQQAHVAYTLDSYGPGTHTWPYWSRDLTQYLPALARVFAAAPATPTSIDYTSIDTDWSQWGWTVDNTRPQAQAWSSLTGASAHGFTFSGTAASVTTPALFRHGASVRVTVNGATRTDRADGSGRLTVSVTGGQTVTFGSSVSG